MTFEWDQNKNQNNDWDHSKYIILNDQPISEVFYCFTITINATS